MNYRNLGRTGVKVSPICLGNLMFGEKSHEQAEEARILEHGVDAGINFLDTANSYGRGGCERRIGEVLKRIGGRDRIVLASKVHGAMADDDPNARGNSRRHIIEQCDASLKRLQTDWIDLYQLHRPQSDIPIDETLRALDDLVRAGKIRYLGTSSFPPGISSSLSGHRRSSVLTDSYVNSPYTTYSTGGLSARSCQWP